MAKFDGSVALKYSIPGSLEIPQCAYCRAQFSAPIGSLALHAESFAVRDISRCPVVDYYYCSSWCYGRPITFDKALPVDPLYRWDEAKRVWDREWAAAQTLACRTKFLEADHSSNVALRRLLREHNASSRQEINENAQ